MPSECRNGSSSAPSSANRVAASWPCVTAARNSSSRVLASFIVMAFRSRAFAVSPDSYALPLMANNHTCHLSRHEGQRMRRIGFVVYPGFQLIGFTASSVFEIANVLSEPPAYELSVLSEAGGLVR